MSDIEFYHCVLTSNCGDYRYFIVNSIQNRTDDNRSYYTFMHGFTCNVDDLELYHQRDILVYRPLPYLQMSAL